MSEPNFYLYIYFKYHYPIVMLQKYFLVAVISFAAISCKRTSPPLTKAEVEELILKFDYGWEHKMLPAVDSTLGARYTYFTQSGGLFSRDSVVATAGESGYILINMSRAIVDINLYGNTAVVNTRWKGKGSYRNVPFDEDQRCSIVIVKEENKVQIVSEHCTPIKNNSVFH